MQLTHSVDMRAGDITTLASLCKSYMYQDMLEKPSELVLYRKVEDGGLGLHNVKCKAMASLISTFLQTAALFRFYCLDKPDIPRVFKHHQESQGEDTHEPHLPAGGGGRGGG